MNENEFYLKLPKHKKSKKPVKLLDSNGEIVGSFQRTLKNKKQIFIDILSLYDLAIINFNIFNKSNDLIASIEGDFTLVKKSTWSIKEYKNVRNGKIRQSSLLNSKSFKVFEITLNDRVFQLKSRNGLYEVRSNNEQIATFEDIDKSKIFAEKYKIKYYCNQDLALLLVTIFYLFLITV